MAEAMWTITEVDALRDRRRSLPGRVAFVPTMGALHEGHLSLMRAAGRLADHVLVSVFVNPTQFGPGEDFERYPRDLDADLAACRSAGVAGVFAPTVDQMYPPGVAACEVNVPELATILEGAARPTHFAGVCRVVLKLLNIVEPEIACFGRKDYQQYRVIDAMARDLHLPVAIAPLPTVREPDGLAMSSRNRYLDAEQRRRAIGLFRALSEAKSRVEEAGETEPAAVEAMMAATMRAHHVEPDYAVVRHPATLASVESIDPPLTGGVVALVAGRLGGVRLIDNMLLGRTVDQG